MHSVEIRLLEKLLSPCGPRIIIKRAGLKTADYRTKDYQAK
jgi:hypothetical protein